MVVGQHIWKFQQNVNDQRGTDTKWHWNNVVIFNSESIVVMREQLACHRIITNSMHIARSPVGTSLITPGIF